jgi:hypothetical protein
MGYCIATLKIVKSAHKSKFVQEGDLLMKEKELVYEAPKVITYSEDEIIELLGPAQTCSPSPCPTYQ